MSLLCSQVVTVSVTVRTLMILRLWIMNVMQHVYYNVTAQCEILSGLVSLLWAGFALLLSIIYLSFYVTSYIDSFKCNFYRHLITTSNICHKANQVIKVSKNGKCRLKPIPSFYQLSRSITDSGTR